MEELTQEYLQSILRFNESKGYFVWIVKPSRYVKIGDIAGCIDKMHFKIKINRKNYQASRLVWLYYDGKFPKNKIRFIDDNSLNIRRENLMDLPQGQINLGRKSKNLSTGIRGVYRSGKSKFKAYISLNGSKEYLGTFNTSDEASDAYCDAAELRHGEFARLS